MRKFGTTMMVMAALAVMAAPALAQLGQDPERGPATMARTPGTMVLEHRAELGLTAEQVSRIEAIQDRVRAENAPRLEQVRAAFGERRPVRDRTRRDMTAEERLELRDQMRERSIQVRAIRQDVRETNRAAGDEIHELLTVEQKAKLLDLRRAARDEWQHRRDGFRDGRRDGRRPHRGYRGPGW